MATRTGWWAVLGMGAALAIASALNAQTLGNQTLTGKYFFRHVSLGTDGSSATSLTESRSLIGSVTFDGAGKYSFTAQQVTGNAAAAPQSGAGNYSVDAGGFVALDNPLRSGQKISLRYGSEALLGSSTESTDNAFDLFIAIPAPAGGATLGGPYSSVSLELPGGATANMRTSQFTFSTLPLGNIAAFPVTGHAVNLSGGRPLTQQVSGATYTMNPDGTGTLTAGTAGTAQLLSGSRTLYVSASGNVVLGGSTANGAHDILIGVKSGSGVTNATWNGSFWAAGLRVASDTVAGYAGSLAAGGQGKVTWTKRTKSLGVGAYDFTGINSYALGADGTGTVLLTSVGLGTGAKGFVGAAISTLDPSAYEVYFGVQLPTLSGTGVFLNPLGVINAASSAPPGNPISPGQFVALYGTGLAASTRTATPPYPPTFNGVTVTIGGKAAPIYFVSAGQINALVPYATTGPTTTIVVQNGTAASNTVTVPVAATAPGVYSMDQSGGGVGAILHIDYSLVNSAKPAAPGETVLIYLTGMGTLTPAVADGTAGVITTLYQANTDLAVLVAGEVATVAFKGLAPGFPGLYQINATLPTTLKTSGPLPLAIQTNNAYHDQVDIWIK